MWPIVGLVKQPREALSLWIVPRSGGGTLDRGDQPYVLENATLGADFREDFDTELAAAALVAVAPLAGTETRGRVLEKGLAVATGKLASLLKEAAVTESLCAARPPEHSARQCPRDTG